MQKRKAIKGTDRSGGRDLSTFERHITRAMVDRGTRRVLLHFSGVTSITSARCAIHSASVINLSEIAKSILQANDVPQAKNLQTRLPYRPQLIGRLMDWESLTVDDNIRR